MNNFFLGTGFDGDQCLGVQLMELGMKKRQILHGDPLSLTRKSYLVWVGFSAEGMKHLHERNTDTAGGITGKVERDFGQDKEE